MAEAILADRFGDTGLRVSSAGLHALVGNPADPLAVELLGRRGLDLSHHRARQLTAEMVLASDLVLAMNGTHQRLIESMLPAVRGRVHRIGRWGDFDVPDPYQQGREVFQEVLDLLDRGIDDFERFISSASGSRTSRKAVGR